MNERIERQQAIQALLQNANIPALSIGWFLRGAIDSAAHGTANVLAPSPVDTDTLFQAASLSKPVSAAILLDWVEQGLWDLDTPLADIADYGPPELRQDPHYRKLTTRMVIGQCSGLANFGQEGDDGTRFIATPNAQFTYSGLALDFLKDVIEKKTGRDWEAIAQDFFVKAGMRSSTFQRQLRDGMLHGEPRQIALAHVPDPQLDFTHTPLPPLADDVPGIPAGSMLTTAEDYVTFLRYCYNNDYLKSTLLTGSLAMHLPTASPDTTKIFWGLGMGVYRVTTPEEKTIAFHWGNNNGSISFCAMDMATGDCVACFANSINGPSVFQQIVKPVVGDLQPLFAWLYRYCCFRDVTVPKAPEVIARSVDELYSFEPIEESIATRVAITDQLHSTLPERRSDLSSESPSITAVPIDAITELAPASPETASKLR